MNLLHNLPESLFIQGQEVNIQTDFRVWLKLLNAMYQSETDEQLVHALKSVFMVDLAITQENIQEIINAISLFLQKAKTYINADYKEPASEYDDESVSHDMELDSNYIFSAFMEQYNIDLTEKDLHYYKFVALFDCLKNETLFKTIVFHRIRDISKIKDREIKQEAQKLKEMFELPKDIHFSKLEREMRERQVKDFHTIWSLKK